MSPRFRSIYVLLLGLLLVGVGGCMPKDTVRLMYASAEPTALPAPTAPHVAVVLLEDKRGQEPIGVRSNGDAFLPGSPVAEWVSRSLADELSRKGPQVSYAPTIQLAQSAQPNYIITGTVDEVWVKEINAATYSAVVRIKLTMANRQGVVFAEGLSATQEKSGIPSSALAENVLTETLRDVLKAAAAKLAVVAR